MKYFFPVHLDGDNRGCEGIAKGTAVLLGEPKESLIGLCRNIPLDTKLGIDKYVTLVPYKQLPFLLNIKNKFIKLGKLLHLCPSTKYASVDQMRIFIDQMEDCDVMLSTGGDMFCYNDKQPSITSCLYAKEKGVKSILWGCSMGPQDLTPIKEKALRSFSLIYARESLSYEFFKSLGLKNVVCLPDPAFVLEPEPVELPDIFSNAEVIGLNLSNLTVGSFNLNTPFGREVKRFVEHILKHTSKKILLIPHVMWEGKGDYQISSAVLSAFPNVKDRISILESDNYNYLQIRYIISKCWCFIGGRTHAVVSAYSTCVPTIALGYSIKARGIAKDLGLSDKLVLDCKGSIAPDILIDRYEYLSEHYMEIKKHMDDIMPPYCRKPYEIRTILKKYL